MSWLSTVNDIAKTGTTDGSLADTQSAIDYVIAKAEDGWEVTVGVAGAPYTWAARLEANIPYNWTLTGASSSNRPSISTSFTGFGIWLGCTAGKLVTLKDFDFPDYATPNAMILVSGTGTDAFRITNCTPDASNHGGGAKFWIQVNTQISGVTTEGPYGLIDHNTCTSTGGFAGVFVRDGDAVASWDRAMSWGTNKAVFIEDNTFTCDTFSAGAPFWDGNNGARVVVRHNTLQNTMGGNHGADNSGPVNSCLQMEVMHNTWTATNGIGMTRAVGCRGGALVFFDNTLNRLGNGDYAQGVQVQYHRAGPLGDGQGINQDRWAAALSTTITAGSNGASLPQATINVADTSALLADFASGAVLPIKVTTSAGVQDVTATGKTGTTFTGCTGGTGTMSTGGAVTKTSDYVGTQQPGSGHVASAGEDPNWPAKAWGSVPMYVWDNGGDSPLTFGIIATNTYGFTDLDRDYFLSAMPGYVEYVYPHPLSSGLTPSPPFNTAPPTISGIEEVGRVLTVTPGTYDGSTPITKTYQWFRCTTP